MELYPGLVFRWAIQGLMVLAAITFVIQWIIPRWRKYFRFQQITSNVSPEERNNSSDEARQASIREKLQQAHTEKANSYKERILVPREEAKRKQKEEEYEKFTGPAWKGQSCPLGGSADDDLEGDDVIESEGQTAVRRRKLPRPANNETELAKSSHKSKAKRVIHLPEEASVDDAGCVTVKLRMPVGQIRQRRFLHTHTMQVLMDYISTLGYSQTTYTIATTYPRIILSEYLNKTLWEMGFQKQVTLNVEEKDD